MLLLSLATAIAIGIGSPGGSAPATYPEPEKSIRVVSTSGDVQFPDEIVLGVEVESDSEITEITVYYRLGRQDVVIYGYPEFTPATRVSADFRIKTSGASYIPTGVDIEYYYVFRDTDGNTFESDRYYLEYRDSRYEWREVREGDLVVLYHNRPEHQVLAVASDVSEHLEPVKRLLGLESVPPMKAVILNDLRESRRTFPFISEASSRGHTFGGFAYGEYDLFVLVGLNTGGMVHEMTHLLIDEALGSPLARIPSWLNEGLAMYFEPGSGGGQTTVERAARDDRLMPLRSMNRVPGRPADVGLFYAQARNVVEYMMEVFGEEKMAALLGAINEGKRIDQSVEDSYGMSLEELEQGWKTRLLGETPLAERPDPGSIGTSVIVAGAIGTAIGVIILRWLVKRLRLF